MSTEVWLIDIRPDAGPPISFASLKPDAGWQLRKFGGKPALVASGHDGPAQIIWCPANPVGEAVAMDFVSHPWSGIVKIQWQQTGQEVDLYKPGSAGPRRVFTPRVAARLDLSPVQVTLLAAASVILLAGAGGWLRRLLVAETSTANPTPS